MLIVARHRAGWAQAHIASAMEVSRECEVNGNLDIRPAVAAFADAMAGPGDPPTLGIGMDTRR